MAATVKNYIIKGGKFCFEGNLSSGTKHKLEVIGNHFSTLSGFKSATIDTLNNLRTVEGDECFRRLTNKETEAINRLQETIDLSLSLTQNFIKILTQDFIKKQIKAIDALTLEGLNANPILCRALKLNTIDDFLKFYVYSAISRSIVTSMGYLVQDLLLFSNEYIFDGKNYSEGIKTKWDVVIDKIGSVKKFLEIKSGPNDMDVAQIKHYAEEIEAVESIGAKGYIGVTYGKKETRTVTTALLETYVEGWRDKTLFGKELWNFISENENYHMILMDTIQSTSEVFLGQGSLISRIDSKIDALRLDFVEGYGSLDIFYNSLW